METICVSEEQKEFLLRMCERARTFIDFHLGPSDYKDEDREKLVALIDILKKGNQ